MALDIIVKQVEGSGFIRVTDIHLSKWERDGRRKLAEDEHDMALRPGPDGLVHLKVKIKKYS